MANPVDIVEWVSGMTLDDKYGLSDHDISQTQALYGDPVFLIEEENGWCRIALPGQKTPKNALGYPGWMPRNHLSDDLEFAGALAAGPVATVCRTPTAWLHDDAELHSKAFEISFLTRLPVLGRSATAVRVATPDRGAKWIPAADVAVAGDPTAEATGPGLIEIAKGFLGLPYIWGGRSGFGPDCSGLTSLVFESAGLELPRDASAQALHGTGAKVDKADLRTGDLLFWAKDNGTGSIHHVAIYIDQDSMIEAPGSANPVRITPNRFDKEYWGAVRYLPDAG